MDTPPIGYRGQLRNDIHRLVWRGNQSLIIHTMDQLLGLNYMSECN